MAHMHPPELPIAVLADPARRGEVEMFKRLAQGLDNSFQVFFRPSVIGMDTDHNKIADFVILHGQYGLLGIALADDALPYVGTEQKSLPYSPIRSALRSLIFALKEQGIRFYIPAPCCVVFAHSERKNFAAAAPDLDYKPIFAEEFPDLQNQIKMMMPISAGFQSTWRVPDAVEKIMPLLQVNTPLYSKALKTEAAVAMAPTVAIQTQEFVQNSLVDSVGQQPARIIYVVRAIDIVLAFATIVALIMLISFVPQGVIQRVVDYSRSWSVSHAVPAPVVSPQDAPQ
jgi:hypothetical protein